INSRRTFYIDEDSWQILIIDHYDGQGRLWRYSEAPSVNYYEVPVFWSTMENHHDLQSGRYIAVGLDNQESAYDFSFQTTPENFSPQALRSRGVRGGRPRHEAPAARVRRDWREPSGSGRLAVVLIEQARPVAGAGWIAQGGANEGIKDPAGQPGNGLGG